MSYHKEKSVYSGPYCDVYKATGASGVVALKVVDLDFVRKPHNFRREVSIVKRLSHPNIVRYVDSYKLGEDHYLVMPFYEVDLVSVMDRYVKKKVKFNLADPQQNSTIEKNELPLETIGPMIHGLVKGLQYIHEQQLIHRDIKPANILFSSLDTLTHPVIADFGISYELQQAPADEPLDHKFTDVSSGYYKAPELCFGVTDYGCEIDLWSLGILISCLYSQNGRPANSIEVKGPEKEPELNDFVLIQGTFQAFGTPQTSDPTGDLFWSKLGSEKYHFQRFAYEPLARKASHELLPRCRDNDLMELFGRLTRYEGRSF